MKAIDFIKHLNARCSKCIIFNNIIGYRILILQYLENTSHSTKNKELS